MKLTSGLPNIGNTCYISSALQILFKSCTKEALKSEISHSTLASLLYQCYKSPTSKSIRNIINHLSVYYSCDFHQQSDSPDFFLKLLSVLEKEGCEKLLSIYSLSINQMNFSCSTCKNVITDTRVSPKLNFIPWFGPSGMNTFDLLHSFLYPKRTLHCTQCDKSNNFIGAMDVKLPKQLVIIISSPYDCKYKITKNIHFKEGDIKYQLRGEIIHRRSDQKINSILEDNENRSYNSLNEIQGHYVCKIKQNHQWHCYNDYYFDQCSLDKGDTVTLLLYRKFDRKEKGIGKEAIDNSSSSSSFSSSSSSSSSSSLLSLFSQQSSPNNIEEDLFQ